MHRHSETARAQPSIFDVASRAGVSASTVSRSLRGMPNVAPATRERVARAAEELSYVASPAASGLASGRTTDRLTALGFETATATILKIQFQRRAHGAKSDFIGGE